KTMKKTFIAILIAVVAVAAIAGIGIAYAKGPGGNGSSNGSSMMSADGAGYGSGMMNTNGSAVAAGSQYMAQSAQGMAPEFGDEILHDGMVAYFANALGIDAADLETRLEAGETMADIAISEGLTLDEFQALMVEARDAAIAQALADGTLTQEQVDQMQQMNQFGLERMGGGYGRGMRGAGQQGQYTNPDCPMADDTIQ
ncbi:MAG: hypothetical protein ACK2TS_05930, partial [Anaerolineales bacterium]